MDFPTLLAALAFSAFTSATILFGTSEIAFTAALMWQPENAVWFWLTAGTANTLGSMVSYGMGRCLPKKYAHKIVERTRARLAKWGAYALLFSWLPIVGDALPLAAGALRLNAWVCAVALAVGKFARYALLWAGVIGATAAA